MGDKLELNEFLTTMCRICKEHILTNYEGIRSILLYQSDKWRFRCGFPKPDFFTTFHSSFSGTIGKFDKVIEFLEEYDPNEEIVEVNERKLALKTLREDVDRIFQMIFALELLIDRFVNLSENPVDNRGEIIECFKGIEQIKSNFNSNTNHNVTLGSRNLNVSKDMSNFFREFLFFRLKILEIGKVYHGVGLHSGAGIMANKRNRKHPRDYVVGVIRRIRGGIRPVSGQPGYEEYNSCSELPAVYCYPRPGLWGIVYFELDCSLYPVFQNTNSSYNATKDSETFIFCKGNSLPLLSFNVVFSRRQARNEKPVTGYTVERYLELVRKELENMGFPMENFEAI
ncbi:hypothetical protein CL616_03885 [archaeon]|nr:hypothetical protein [archaeon]|tara:strand:- start:2496 stop:3518 length:1023 start_codon:yes stop_codon:yes gene_type:complete